MCVEGDEVVHQEMQKIKVLGNCVRNEEHLWRTTYSRYSSSFKKKERTQKRLAGMMVPTQEQALYRMLACDLCPVSE